MEELIRERNLSASHAVYQIAVKLWKLRSMQPIRSKSIAGRESAAYAGLLAQCLALDQVNADGRKEHFMSAWGEALDEQDPLEGLDHPVVLIVKGPVSYQMDRLVLKYQKLLGGIIIDGPFENPHWATFIAVDLDISVVGGLQGVAKLDLAQLVKTGIYMDAIARRVIVNPSRQLIKDLKLDEHIVENDSLRAAMKAVVAQPATTMEPNSVEVKIDAVLADFPKGKVSQDSVGLFRTEFLFSGEQPQTEEAWDAYFNKMSADFLALARGLKGKASIRLIDRKQGDKNTWFDAMDGGDKSELDWSLNTPVGRDILKRQIKCLMLAHAGLSPEELAAGKGIEFFPPVVETLNQVKIIKSYALEVRDKNCERSNLTL